MSLPPPTIPRAIPALSPASPPPTLTSPAHSLR
ncbi:hypothetical protein E2C01_043627 [Portunus trituberculatus]|uniref:Uncharacterized protein n=1 Tax=Portunus trituberculatus TaxID=210409 RepID=A0A5B7FXU2_PORTR|nr:hypothetical protein [Portunus trituberculatus]